MSCSPPLRQHPQQFIDRNHRAHFHHPQPHTPATAASAALAVRRPDSHHSKDPSSAQDMDSADLDFDSVPVAGVDSELGYRMAVAGLVAAGCRMVHSFDRVVDAGAVVGSVLKARLQSRRRESSFRSAAAAGGEDRAEGGWWGWRRRRVPGGGRRLIAGDGRTGLRKGVVGRSVGGLCVGRGRFGFAVREGVARCN